MSMIETINLTKKYGELTALDNLNLQVESGSCVGFIGPNGAGKTTTIKILATLLKPSWGEARIDGKVIGYQNHLIRPIIGYVPDFMGSYDDMLVAEYLEFFASCYGIHGPARMKAVTDVLELTDLAHKRESEVNGLSRGMQQRLSVARVLLHDPQVLLLDEPSSGLDPRARVEMRELLKELRRMGKTILISSHILFELAELCTDVAIIEQGKLLFAGPMREVMARTRTGRVLHVLVEGRHDEAVRLLRGVAGIREVDAAPHEGVLRIEVRIDERSDVSAGEVNARLLTAGIRVSHLAEERLDLETAFMRLTKGLVA